MKTLNLNLMLMLIEVKQKTNIKFQFLLYFPLSFEKKINIKMRLKNSKGKMI